VRCRIDAPFEVIVTISAPYHVRPGRTVRAAVHELRVAVLSLVCAAVRIALPLDPGRASAPRIAVPHMLPSSE
jgi:hypothetical protein